MFFKVFLFFVIGMLLFSCEEKENHVWKSIEVRSSAFNSVPSQTDNQPSIAAWGDTLKPGMKCIAVARNLIGLGLDHNTQVKIEGLSGIYLVKDKMNARYSNRIDIYMGEDVERAKEWGQKELKIEYAVEKETPANNP